MKVITGNIRVHARGFGFVKGEEEEVFIPRKATNGAVDGDEVEVEVSPKRSEKGWEGRVRKILKRGRSHVAGTVAELYKKVPYAFVPLLSEEYMRIDTKQKLRVGERIVIRVKDWGTKRAEPCGELVSVLGHISDPKCDIKAAVEEFELEGDFPKKVVAEARAFGEKVEDISERRDLRNLECLTIDPTTAKDFDDALSIEIDKQGHFHVGVHIADVSHYVKPGTALDQEARKRCNSTYLPGTVIPMLPHELSSHLCSLMPNVDRLTLSVLVELDSSGDVVDYEITRSVIHSKKRFTYEEAKEVLDGKKKSPHKKRLEQLVKLCHVLKKKRAERGCVEFALPETVLRLDQDGMPTHVEIVEYDITHQLVEECMLLANALVAKHLSDLGKPLTYRIHEEPFEEKTKEFAAVATALGFKLPERPTAEELQAFFDQVQGSALGKFFATSFIRTMKLAQYSTENIGHYGLGLEHYTHFTSPIRRYIDLIVHRVLMGEGDGELEKIAEQCSEKERLSARAENSVLNLKKLRLLDKMVKDEHLFDAIVTTVKPMGFAFEVTEYLLEGFVPVSAFEDHFTFDHKSFSLKSRDQRFCTGDKISVYPEEIDFITQEVIWGVYEDV